MLSVLIDADNFIYKAGCIRKYDMQSLKNHSYTISPLGRDEEPFYNVGYSFLPLEVSKNLLDDRIAAIQHACRSKYKGHKKIDFTLYLSPDDGSNFRNFGNKYTVYKGNRRTGNPKQPLPFYLKELRQYLITEYGAVIAEGMEADDLVCIESHLRDDCVVCSNDKDVLYGFAGRKLNSDALEFFDTSENEAVFYFCSQLLMGDTADNISGIKGYGPAKTSKHITKYAEEHQELEYKEACLLAAWEVYYKAYDGDNGEISPQDVFVENARLLWLLRNKDDSWHKHFKADFLRKYYE